MFLKRQSEGGPKDLRFVDAAGEKGLNIRDPARDQLMVHNPPAFFQPEVPRIVHNSRGGSSHGNRSSIDKWDGRSSSDWFESHSQPSRTNDSRGSFLDKLGDYQHYTRPRGSRPTSAAPSFNNRRLYEREESAPQPQWAHTPPFRPPVHPSNSSPNANLPNQIGATCKKCHKRLDAAERFCGGCGTQVPGSKIQQQQPQYQSPPPRKGPRRGPLPPPWAPWD